jgi:NADH-quinone oxidoreductase subunit M
MGWIDDPSGSAQFVDGPWIWISAAGLKTGYHLAVDGINLHLILLTALIAPLTAVSSWIRDPGTVGKARGFWTLVFQTGLLGALTSFDLVLLASFWMVTILAAFFVAGGHEHTTRAAAQLAAAGALVAAALLAVTIGLAVHQPSLGLADAIGTSFAWQAQAWMFWVMAAACAIAGAVFPLHLWYPATSRAPSATQVLIGSLLLNLGGYGMIRICLLLFPLATASFAPVVIGLSTAGVLYASLAALGHHRLPGALAYWNVAHMGLVVIGIFGLQNLGLHGAVMGMVANSLSTTTLLFLSADDPEGEGRVPPGREVKLWRWTGAARVLGLLSAIGTPGLIGFLGKGLLVMGIARWQWHSGLNWGWYAVILLGILLGTWALIRATAHTPLFTAENGHYEQVLVLLPLLVLILIVGLRPSLASDITGPSIHRLLQEVRLGLEQDLLRMAPSPEPGEPGPPPPTTPDEGQTAQRPLPMSSTWALLPAR